MPNNNVTALRGSSALLTLAKSDDSAEGKLGAEVSVEYGLETVGRVIDVVVEVLTTLDEFHEIGRRHPVTVHSGHIRVRGRVRRAYVNGALLRLLLGNWGQHGVAPPPGPEVQPSFNLILDLTDPSSTATPQAGTKVVVEGVQFENWAVAVPLDEFIFEDATFKAVRVTRDEKTTSPTG